MSFPVTRPRRLRKTEGLRRLVRETRLFTDDLVQPLFIVPGEKVRTAIPSLPGQFHLSADEAALEVKELYRLGIPAVILFGIPTKKDEIGSSAWNEKGEVQSAVRSIREAAPGMVIITDVCLCEYTDHGHCGLVKDGVVQNDETLKLLSRVALSHAKAGADVVAPSDMMDGRVAAIRSTLDASGYQDVAILAYAVKYASAFYGPFRDAAGSAPAFGDRRGYQMDPPNALEALREAELDVQEGADILMVKPGMAYSDILYRVKERFGYVTATYQVSGEYAMIEAAAEKGWIDRKRVILESLISLKRAGADFMLTYFAKEVAGWLAEEGAR